MAKFLIAQEAIASPDQICDVYAIGQAFAVRGHDVTYVVDDLIGLYGLAGPGAKLQAFRAPQLAVPAMGLATDKAESLAGKLGLAGYGDPARTRALLAEWDAMLRQIAPAGIIGVSAPSAWLIGSQIAPTLAAGSGLALPGTAGKRFADVPGLQEPPIDPAAMVKNLNVALAERNLAPLIGLSDLFARCKVVRYGLDELDPYRAVRHSPSVGALGESGFTPAAVGQRLAMFLDVRCPNMASIILAIPILGDIGADMFISGSTPAMRNYLAQWPQIRQWERFDDAFANAFSAAAIVHHGSPFVASHAIRLGRPQLVLPWTGEQAALIDGLSSLGVTWFKDPRAPMEELGGTMRGVIADVSIAAQAAFHGARLQNISNALPKLVNHAEQMISGRRLSAVPIEIQTYDTPSPSNSRVAAKQQATSEGSSKLYCSMPFDHLCIGTEGTARICCVAQEHIVEDGVPMSLYTSSVDQIWNSDYMREVRRAMVAGEKVAPCAICDANERATGQSYRTETGFTPFGGAAPDREAVRNVLEKDGYRVKERPGFIKLELGNLCNLKCRMCYGANSSEIERDSVHTSWNGGSDPLHAVWQGDVAKIGPDLRIGILRSAVQPREYLADGSHCWTDGYARFNVPIAPGTVLEALEVHVSASLAAGVYYRIDIDGITRGAGSIDPHHPVIEIDLADKIFGGGITIEVHSAGSPDEIGSLGQGLPIADLRLRRKPPFSVPAHTQAEVVGLRLPRPGLWYDDDNLVFEELLGDLSKLQRFFVTGGEPLLEARFFKILDYIIERGAAKTIDLEIVTNATRVNEEIMAKLSQFRKLDIALSIDGIGPVYDYMRYPARWQSVERNIRLMKELAPQAKLIAIPVAQIYNVLGIVDICRFCDSVGIDLGVNFIQMPERLKVENLPSAVLDVAASRLRDYGQSDCPPEFRAQVLSMARYLEAVDGAANVDMLHEFMLFTNDLDLGRNQSMAASLPELHDLLVKGGFAWTSETRFAPGRGERVRARDRVHAWV